MPKTRLTAASVERIKPPAKGQSEYYDELLPSFGLRVSYDGAKAWFVMCRAKGKLLRMTIGRFPGVSLAKAREKARKIKGQAEAGIDPRKARQEELGHEAKRQLNTFVVAAEEFMSVYARKKLRPATVREYQRALLGSDTAKLRPLPLSEITKRHISQIIEAIDGRGSPGAANRTLAYLKKFFSWCADRGIISLVPTDRIDPPQTAGSRERVLADNEIRLIWSAFNADDQPFGNIFKLLLVTGQRRSEVAGMRWDEIRDINGEHPRWEIPGSRTKNKLAHIVPLSPLAVTILREMHSTNDAFVFTTTGVTSVSGFSKAKHRIDARIAENHTALPAWTLHDLRRTMVTKMNEELKIPPHIVEAVVNHVSGPAKRGVAGVYNRALYMEERRQALNAWAANLENIIPARRREEHPASLLGKP